jgi:hypothetical protein
MGTVHFEFIPQDQTVNQAYYMEILKQMLEALHRKRPESYSTTEVPDLFPTVAASLG